MEKTNDYAVFKNLTNPAILLGNGLNLYAQGKRNQCCGNSYLNWIQILALLAAPSAENAEERIGRLIKEGEISLPEIYTAIQFTNYNVMDYEESLIRAIQSLHDYSNKEILLESLSRFRDLKQTDEKYKKRIARLMSDWHPILGVHNKFTDFVAAYQNNGVPILTTNYDNLLEQSQKIQNVWSMLEKNPRKYLFGEYYAPREMSFGEIANSFAIWHIHGDIRKPSSIKISTSDYAKLMQELYRHRRDGTHENNWMRLFYENDLIILGLKLSISEYPLRWLLTDRMEYVKSQSRKIKTIYYDIKKDKSNVSEGKRYFLESIGIEIYNEYKTYDELYSVFGVVAEPTEQPKRA